LSRRDIDIVDACYDVDDDDIEAPCGERVILRRSALLE